MLLFQLLHPAISSLGLRIIGAIAIFVLIAALAVFELSNAPRKKLYLSLGPVFIVALAVLAYAILIAQGSIR